MKWKIEWLLNGMKFPQEPTVEGNIYSGTIYLCEILESQLRTSGNSFLCLRSLTCHWSQTLFSQCLVLQIKHPLFFFLNWKMSVIKGMCDSEAPRPAPTSRRWQSDTNTWLPSHFTNQSSQSWKSSKVWDLLQFGTFSDIPNPQEAAGGAQPSQGSFLPLHEEPTELKGWGECPAQRTNSFKVLWKLQIMWEHESFRKMHPEEKHSIVLPLVSYLFMLPGQYWEQSETAVGLQGSTPIHRERCGIIKQPLLESLITTGLHISKGTLYLLNYKTWKQHVQVIYQ